VLRTLLAVSVSLPVGVAVHFLSGGSEDALARGAATTTAHVRPAPRNERQWIRQTVARMSLREKVGQLFEVNGYGASVRDPNPAMVKLNRHYYGVSNIAQLIRKYHPGGIIYFAWTNNLQNPGQIARLSNGIQSVALHGRTRLPMVISTDQEGGEVLRIGSPAAVFPGNMPLGATRSVLLAHQAGLVMGRELRAMGMNVDNAPVVDVNVQPLNQADGIRAYGDRVPLVSTLGAAEIRAMQTNQATRGVGATAKHWPGFGAAKENSDFSVATSPQTLSQVMKVNAPPFRAAMKAGLDRIMVTHLLFPKVTGSQITSLSRFWVDGVLRGKLRYNGPVVTDALDAAALKALTPQQIALRALRAGDDELLEIAQCSSTPPCSPGSGGNDPAPADLVRAYPAVLKAAETHKISAGRLDQSIARILDLKWRLGLIRTPFVNVRNVPRVVGTRRHLAVMQRLADNSITLLKNSAGLLPLAKDSGKKILVTGFGVTTTATLGSDIAARGLTSDVFMTGFSPSAATISAAVSKAAQDDLVIVSTFNAWTPGSPGQIQLVNRLLATGKPVIVAAVGTPYDAAYFPNATTLITSYGFQPVSLDPLVRVLFGELQPAGALPVTITKPPPSHQVLYPFGFRLELPQAVAAYHKVGSLTNLRSRTYGYGDRDKCREPCY
jgi:beta-N-acetylhexosaminidase